MQFNTNFPNEVSLWVDAQDHLSITRYKVYDSIWRNASSPVLIFAMQVNAHILDEMDIRANAQDPWSLIRYKVEFHSWWVAAQATADQ